MLPVAALSAAFVFDAVATLVPDEPEAWHRTAAQAGEAEDAPFALPADEGEAQHAVVAVKTGDLALPVSEQTRQGLRVGDINLMVGYEAGSELTEVPDLFRLPNTPAWFCGVVNLHGRIIPVFDLVDYLGIDHGSTEKQMLLVLGQGAEASGILIDGLPRRLRWMDDEDSIPVDVAPEKLQAHARQACLIDGALWFDLDVPSLLKGLEDGLRSG